MNMYERNPAHAHRQNEGGDPPGAHISEVRGVMTEDGGKAQLND